MKFKSSFQYDNISAWLLFTSAIVTDNSVRDKFIQSAWARASFNGTHGAFPDHYDDGSGQAFDGFAG